MRGVEFFAGSRSIGKVAESLGMEVFSVDWQPFENINYVGDVEFMTIKDVPFVPDWGWFSPDCTTYSIASCSTHRKNSIIPKTDYAKKCDRVNQHFLSMIDDWLELNPNFIFFIENPRGMLRKMPFMQKFDRATITYCKYGDDRMKPTDIWSNYIYNPIFNPNGWKPIAKCFNSNKNCHHEPAPRGSKTGTQGKKGSYDRSKIPQKLCLEVLKSIL